MTLIAVALRADAGEVCQDHIQMFDYGYNNFEKLQVPGGCVIVPKGTDISSLKVVAAEVEGKTEQTYYYQNDVYVGKGVKGKESVEDVPIEITPESSDVEEMKTSELEDPRPVTENGSIAKDIFYIIIDILIGLIVLALAITAYASRKRKKRRRKRRSKS